MTEQAATQAPAPFTAEQALDEAVLLLIRKTRRLAPEAFGKIWRELPEGARDMISDTENRADRQRSDDQLAGIKIGTRPFPAPFEFEDVDEDDE
jgi:hypothetical protein